MSECVTISEAARRLGISRPRLSTYIKGAGIEKTLGKGGAVVPFDQVSKLVQRLSAEGKLRVSTRSKRSPGHLNETPSTQAFDASTLVHTMNKLMDRLSEENKELKDALKTERNQASKQLDLLSDKIEAMRAEISSLKLLPQARAGATLDIEGLSETDILASVVDKARERMGAKLITPPKGRWRWGKRDSEQDV